MKVGTIDAMRKMEKVAIESIGIPSIVLMENAAHKVIDNIDLKNNKNFVVICGNGNNGGDGLAIARNLKIEGKNVDVFLSQRGKNLSKDCKLNYDILKKLGVRINQLNNLEDFQALRDCLIRSDITIDSLFGTGLNRDLDSFYIDMITVINENSNCILSVDIPSGMEGNNGKVMGNAIKANKTITFQIYKKGFLAYETLKYTGKIIVENIGIPKEIVDRYNEKINITEAKNVKKLIPLRDTYGYKGDYGKVLIIAGNEGYTGAAYISTEAAVKSGAGLVTLSTKESIKNILCGKLEEAMTSSYENKEELLKLVEKSDVIAIGPGMGNNKTTLNCLKLVLDNSKVPVIIDADGINVLKDNENLIQNRKYPIIITPHLGEMSKLSGRTIEYIRNNRLSVASEIAKKFKIIVLLKGYNTVITDGESTYINPTGNSSMASGGMGDCLTGIIASFIAQKCDLLKATSIAAFVHGYAGEVLSKERFSVSATDIIEALPNIIKQIQLN